MTFQHFVFSWSGRTLDFCSSPWLWIQSVTANHGSFQGACVPIGCSMLRVLATDDVAMSWLALETSDVPYVLKLASGDLTSWAASDTVSRLKLSWDGAVYTAATFPATVQANDYMCLTWTPVTVQTERIFWALMLMEFLCCYWNAENVWEWLICCDRCKKRD